MDADYPTDDCSSKQVSLRHRGCKNSGRTRDNRSPAGGELPGAASKRHTRRVALTFRRRFRPVNGHSIGEDKCCFIGLNRRSHPDGATLNERPYKDAPDLPICVPHDLRSFGKLMCAVTIR